MLTFAQKYKGGDYSQNGEAGLIDECIKRIGLIGGVAVEFGAPTKTYCSNIYHLSKTDTWACHWFDNDPKEKGITKLFVTSENVNTLPRCTVISMDTDGSDYDLWKAYKGKPDVVVIEINSSIRPLEQHSSRERGASYITMVQLGISKGYFLLCHTGNLIFVLNRYKKLFPEIDADPIEDFFLYFNSSWL